MYWTTPSGTRYHTGWPASARRRQSVDEIARAGTSSVETTPGGSPSTLSWWPGRETATKCAIFHSSSASFQVRICSIASAPVMKKSSASGRASRRSRSVSTVKVSPGRSTSTRLTVKRGFEAVAMTVMRYRCSAGLTLWCCLNDGLPVGTNTTSSRSNRAAASLAATRWPWWMGSNVPPITPRRGRRGLIGASSVAGASVVRYRSVPRADAAERVGHEQQGHEPAEPEQPVGERRDGQVRRGLGAFLGGQHDGRDHDVLLEGRPRAGRARAAGRGG